MTHRNLASLALDDLAEELVREFTGLRNCVAHDYYGEVQRLLARVVEARDVTSGAQLAVLEVAEAAVRAAARLQWGRSELALRAFASAVPDRATRLLEDLLLGPVARERFDAVARDAQAEAEALLRTGALIPDGEDAVRLAARLRPATRDLLRPPVLRMWAAVENVRQEALDSSKPAALIASRLAIDLPPAKEFLREFPLQPDSGLSTSAGTEDEPLGRSVAPFRVLYRRPEHRAAPASDAAVSLLERLEKIGVRDPIPVSVTETARRQDRTAEPSGSEAPWVA